MIGRLRPGFGLLGLRGLFGLGFGLGGRGSGRLLYVLVRIGLSWGGLGWEGRETYGVESHPEQQVHSCLISRDLSLSVVVGGKSLSRESPALRAELARRSSLSRPLGGR